MFCFKCGASMPDDATVCPKCAAPVQVVQPPASAAAPPPAATPNQPSTSAWLNVPPAQPQNPPQAQYPPQAQPYRGQYQAQTDGGAIASMVLGIASFALCLNVLTGIPAIILGHISLSKIKKSMGRLKGEGMAVAGLIMGYISLPFILIFAAILIPNLLRAKIAANESQAMSTVRTINTAQVTYSTTYPNQGYARDLATLGSGGNDCSGGGTAEHACLLDNLLGGAGCTSGAWCQKGPYRYTVSSNCNAPAPAGQEQGDQSACAEYVVAATPILASTGSHSYCAVSDAVIRVHFGLVPTSPSAEECQQWRPI